ncbi:MAG TPA: 3-phosphoshikimate 1-carboxyvinyltransferase [Myxococcales bacterium]|nr:3-phosphoshikimate 1-carboxyvinyltransferase [Myxococcales bacterium]
MKARVAPLRARLRGEGVRVPGDKSISHRALLFAALAEGESRIAGLAGGEDVRSTARCLAQLGVPLLRGDGTPWRAAPRSAEFPHGAEEPRFVPPARPAGSAPLPERDADMQADDAIVIGQGLSGLRQPLGDLDCGNSGTTLRLFAGVLAGAGVEATLTGDPSLSRRPMERVARPLRQLGASVETTQGKPPVTIRAGHPLHAGAISSEVASAQVKSAVLLAGLFAEGETSFTEPARSRDHTERMLRMMGADLVQRGNTVAVRGRARLRGFALDVPGDLSSAAFLVAAALVSPAGSSLSLEHVGVNPTRAGFLDALAMFGARIGLELEQSGGPEPVAKLTVSAQRLRGAQLDGELVLRAIDEVPILAVLGACAEGETVIRGAAELRVKESDRIAQMAAGLRAMGAEVEELPDGLRIQGAGPARLRGGAAIDSAMDHRIALAFSVAALAAHEPCTISGAEWADVSFPGFFALLRKLGAEVEILR